MRGSVVDSSDISEKTQGDFHVNHRLNGYMDTLFGGCKGIKSSKVGRVAYER